MRIAHTTRSRIISLTTRRFHFLINLSKPLSCFHSLHNQRSLSLIETLVFMATENLSSSSTAISAEDDAKYGFKRDEMYSSNLAGTVDAYYRHLFLCYKSPEAWAPRVENSDEDPLPKLIASTIMARKKDITVKTKVTICGGGEGSDGDVLIFPEMIKYKGLKESDVDGFVEDVIVNCKPWASGVQEVLTGSHVFVCAHASRDKRCGVCGPELIGKLKEEIESRGLKDQVFVSPCSHIGGHKYAGNLIIYSPDSEGKIMGHWYGYVTPDDVPALLDQHIAKGEIIERLWRGLMGASTEEGGKGEEQKVPKEKEAEKSNSQVNKEITGGCCQVANNGVSCCRDGGLEANGDKEKAEVDGKKGEGKLQYWMGQWEVLTAVGVVGAAATVAIAYSVFRRSG